MLITNNTSEGGMGPKKSKKALVISLIALGVILAVIAIVAVVKANTSSKVDPYKPQTSNQSADSSDSTDTVDETKTSDSDAATQPAPAASTLDPDTVSTIDIAALGLTVSYVKGVGGFEYEVLRTPSGTQYVEFRSESLRGSKCTNDMGAFASILEKPESAESATVTKTVEVAGTKYGLSLAASSCTSDQDLLKQYQASFSDAFSLLKKTS